MMLSKMTLKLCPLMALAMATVGCGKKATEPVAQDDQNTENQELPSAYILRLDGNSASRKQFKLPEATVFEIPDRLKIRSGNTTGKVVEISYNVKTWDSDDFDFKCSYSASLNPNEMKLDYCMDYDNNDFGDVTGSVFTLYKHQLIQMKFTGAPSSDLVVEVIYGMDWF